MIKVIWQSDKRLHSMELSWRRLAGLGLAAVLLTLGAVMGLARVYKSPAALQVVASPAPDPVRRQVDATIQEARGRLDGMAVRLARLQSQVIRLEALGQRMARQSGLDIAEFDFTRSPAMGGDQPGAGVDRAAPGVDVLAELEALSAQLQARSDQFNVLDAVISHRRTDKAFTPAGWPLARGWISSAYGWRLDPIDGKRRFHKGLDLAGPTGQKVYALAAGVVREARRRAGYGRMVEVDHGNGYVTRYGHNREILVKAGQVVRKGQPLAVMGSTGRSTGPHVHLEVLKDGRPIDPHRLVTSGPRPDVAG